MLSSRRSFGFFPWSRREEVIDRVPTSKIDRVVQDFTDAGAIRVTTEKSADDTWRVTAVFE